jgi:hypothetical protein
MNNAMIEAVGYLADFFFLLSYWLVSSGKLQGEGKVYNWLVLGGAISFGVYAYFVHSVQIFILELFFGGIAIKALLKAYHQKV